LTDKLHDLIDIAWCCYEIGSWNMSYSLLESLIQQQQNQSDNNNVISKSLNDECCLKWETLCRMFSARENFANYRAFLSRRLCMFPLPTLTIPVLGKKKKKKKKKDEI